MKKNNKKIIVLLLLLPATMAHPGWLSDTIKWLFKPIATYAKESPKTFSALVGLSALTLFSYTRARARKAEHTKIRLNREARINETNNNQTQCAQLKKDIERENWRIDAEQIKIVTINNIEIPSIEKSIHDTNRLNTEKTLNEKRMRENIGLATEELEAKKHQLQELRSRKKTLNEEIAKALDEKKKYTTTRNQLALATVKAIELQTR